MVCLSDGVPYHGNQVRDENQVRRTPSGFGAGAEGVLCCVSGGGSGERNGVGVTCTYCTSNMLHLRSKEIRRQNIERN